MENIEKSTALKADEKKREKYDDKTELVSNQNKDLFF